jgi:hypothetical protein
LTPDPIYLANPDVVYRREDDEAILYHPESGDVKLLNRTSAFVFRLLDGRRRLSEITAMVVREYDGADPEEVHRDIDDFIKVMVNQGFILTVA